MPPNLLLSNSVISFFISCFTSNNCLSSKLSVTDYKEKLGYGVTVGQLKAVFQRGVGAFSTSHSPKVKSATQWAMARVNAYLYLVKNGRPQNPKYTTDYDLLPKKHPKSKKK